MDNYMFMIKKLGRREITRGPSPKVAPPTIPCFLKRIKPPPRFWKEKRRKRSKERPLRWFSELYTTTRFVHQEARTRLKCVPSPFFVRCTMFTWCDHWFDSCLRTFVKAKTAIQVNVLVIFEDEIRFRGVSRWKIWLASILRDQWAKS